jgi:hypothetical protein
MAKWMSEQFIKGLSEKVKESLTDPFKELAKEYNSLKKVEQLPNFVKKVWDYYPKANKYEVCLINLFEPGLGYAIDLSAVDETAKDKFFKRIDAFSKVDDLETIIPFPHTFSTPRCVRMFKDADGYEVDEIETSDGVINENAIEDKSTETTSDESSETSAAPAGDK